MERKIFWLVFTVLGLASRFRFAVMVGAVFDHSDRLYFLVGRLSQWMVRMNRTRHRWLVAAALCSCPRTALLARLLIPPPVGPFIISPLRIVNGSPVVIRVTTPKPVTTLAGKWLGHELAFSFDRRTKTWVALAGASLETKPGSYPLELRAETSNGRAYLIRRREFRCNATGIPAWC